MVKKLGPLGLLPEFKLKGEAAIAMPKLESLDLAREKSAWLAAHPDQADLVDVLERELKRFLALRVLFPKRDYALAPAHLIDELWHEFILNTRKYTEFCQDTFKKYVHHEPEDSQAQKKAVYTGELARYTKELMVKSFGGLDVNVWGTTATCNDIGKCIG